METDKANGQQEQDSQEGEQQAVRAKWPKHPWGRDPIVWFTGVIAACAIVQGFFAYYQRQDSIESSKQTQAIVDTQEDIAGYTHASALAAQQAATAIENSVVQAEDATRQTLDESRKSLDATIEIARNDQRAWLGVVTPTLSLPPQKPNVFMVIKNFGRSPALNVGYTIHLMWKEPGPEIKPDVSREHNSKLAAVVQPGEELTAEPAKPISMSEEWVRRVRATELTVYMCGEVHYSDIFDREHHTTFAYELLSPGPPSKWLLLTEGNTAD